MLQRKPDRVAVGGAVEPALRQHGVQADEHTERQREDVDRVHAEGQPPLAQRIESHPRKSDGEQDLLPGLDCGERTVAEAGAVERRHDGVVCGQTDDPRVQREDGPSPDGGRRQDEQEYVDHNGQCRPHQSSVLEAGARADAAPPSNSGQLVAPRPHLLPLLPHGREPALMLSRGSAD